MAIPPDPEFTEPSDDISPDEMERRLCGYIDDVERANAERKRQRGPQRRAWLCELTDKAARGPTPSLRAAALTSLLENSDDELVDALEEFCERTPVESLAPCVFSAAQARDLLAWLKKQPKSTTRDLMLRVLRPAVDNKHAFAIEFYPAKRADPDED
jgi:hypothetical protein